MTLSDAKLLPVLKSDLVCGAKNIMGEAYAGRSGAHETDDPAFYTTNGAGPHNQQLFLLSADGTVLTCLPGFWAPQDLAVEIAFARDLDRVWRDPALDRAAKDAAFRRLHLDHVKSHPADMVRRSRMQGFDAKYELEQPTSDFTYQEGDYVRPELAAQRARMEKKGRQAKHPALKTCDQVMHERMAAHPFQSYESFDVAALSTYGKWSYDKARFDGSEAWPREQRVAMKQAARAREQKSE